VGTGYRYGRHHYHIAHDVILSLLNSQTAIITSTVVVLLLPVSRDITQRDPAEALPPIFSPEVSKAAPVALPLAIKRAVFESVWHAAIQYSSYGKAVVPVGVASQVGRVMSSMRHRCLGLWAGGALLR
jgi:hypothetical protein